MICNTCQLPIYPAGVTYTGPACMFNGHHSGPYPIQSPNQAVKPHECQYTIPVQWSYDWIELEKGSTRRFTNGKRVTKLRCPCGKEIDR